MRSMRLSAGLVGCMVLASILAGASLAAEPLGFAVKLDTVLEHDDGKFLWFHPRVAAIPKAGRDGRPAAVMTLQKHLHTSDHYSGLYFMRSDDLGTTWTKPKMPPELDWRMESDKVAIAVADVTPIWHAPTGKMLAVGAEVRYSKKGEQLNDRPRSHQTAYAVYDPKSGKWTGWRRLEMPADDKWNFARSACAQGLVQADGTLLLPFYFGRDAATKESHVTVVRCSFDGREVKYQRNGTELTLNVERGLNEPSLIGFQGKYYLTIRNDRQGYVTVSDDGLDFRPIRPWTFDDGKELGSYNTQQHWLAHSDGLFLSYTRRGANNDHVIRHRAPLFLAQVDPEKLHVLRATEKVLMPERGATLGNFGAAAITPHESWVTASEGIWDSAARKRGARGATFLARVRWAKPNKMVAGEK
ncbi:MAG: exo-alpha-sialidase [Planctomycetes bacterium]|nr:exo-alpha-sialidase [Planctomycetota bacterium]